MTNLEELQAIFLQWLKHHEVRSISQIRLAAKNLASSFEFEGKPMYWLFYPLVRKGFVEFTGNDTYQVAPPVVIHNREFGISTGVNLNANQLTVFCDNFEHVSFDKFGILRFYADSKKTKVASRKANCHYSETQIEHLLSNFPNLLDVISNFETINVSPNGYKYNPATHTWNDKKQWIDFGIFKTDIDSYVFYFFNGNRSFSIPSVNFNPDSRFIAETYQAVKEVTDFIFYQEKEKELILKWINLPILIDRILRIPSLHLEGGVQVKGNQAIYKNISASTIKQLNRIIGHTIKIK